MLHTLYGMAMKFNVQFYGTGTTWGDLPTAYPVAEILVVDCQLGVHPQGKQVVMQTIAGRQVLPGLLFVAVECSRWLYAEDISRSETRM